MKVYTIALLSLLAISNSSFSQPKEPNIIKVSPFVFLKGQLIEVHYERAFYNNLSAGIGVAPVIFPPIIGALIYPVSEFNPGIAIDPEIRWYAKSDKVMDGFFIGLYSSNRFSSWTSSGKTDDLFYTGDGDPYNVKMRKSIVGFQLGTERLFGKHFVFDFYSGLGLVMTNYKATNSITNETEETPAGGINFRLNIAMGYRF